MYEGLRGLVNRKGYDATTSTSSGNWVFLEPAKDWQAPHRLSQIFEPVRGREKVTLPHHQLPSTGRRGTTIS